jgi:hypothetical protein
MLFAAKVALLEVFDVQRPYQGGIYRHSDPFESVEHTREHIPKSWHTAASSPTLYGAAIPWRHELEEDISIVIEPSELPRNSAYYRVALRPCFMKASPLMKANREYRVIARAP